MIAKFKCGTKSRNFLICVLIVAMLLIIGVPSHKVYAATGVDSEHVTVSPSVIVGSYKELVRAIDEARDGDVIGIGSNICIEEAAVLGNSEKRLTLLRMAEFGYIHVYDSGIVEFKNITFDGNSSIYDNGYIPMIQVNGKVDFEDVIFQNCYNQWAGGAIIAESGEVNIIRCHFTNNQAGEGGHIVVHSSAHVKATNSIFENGVSTRGGGVARIESSYDANGEIEFVACKMFENQARYGGAIANKGSVKITDSIIYGNTAETGADFLNYSGSSFDMDSIEELVELYATDGIRPLKWENDYIDKAYIEGDIDKDNPLSAMRLKYEKITQENDADKDNTEITDKTSNNDDTKDKTQDENNDNKNDSLTDSGNKDIVDNTENKNDISTNNPINGNSNIENESKGDNQSEGKQGEQNQSPSDVTDLEQNKPSDSSASGNNSDNSTAADLDSNTENGNTENDNKENQDKQDNQGDLVNNGGSSSDSGKKDSENGNSNVSNVPAESGNQTDNPNIDKPNTGNEGFASDLKPEDNKQSGSTVNNENQGSISTGDTGNNNNNSINPNKPVVDNGNDAASNNSSENTNNGSGSSTGNTNINTGTSQSGENVSPKPEDSKDFVSSDKEETVASDSDNGDTTKKTTVTKKKAIKKLTITAKKGKRKITGKTIKKATVKVKIGKKTYKVKSNAKGKFTIKLKGKAKLKKGQKIKVTISKTGYKAKSKTYKVK